MSDYLIGQRLIFSSAEIVIACEPPRGCKPAFWSYQWVRRANGVEQCVALSNLKPLPGGQL